MLVLQDPTDPNSTFLLESLLDCFTSAKRLGGMFSFVSASGVRLLTDDQAFSDVASHHPIDLVIGIDAVTDNDALDALGGVQSKYPRMSVRAFLNPRPQSLFHPKFCWTTSNTGGRLIAGSGNLTESGLLGNWEAYSINPLSPAEATNIETLWNDWTARHAEELLPLNDTRVRKRVLSNTIMAPEGDLPTLVAKPTTEIGPTPNSQIQPTPKSAVVLIAEIPRSGNRWSQANFHRKDYVEFFGAVEGESRLMIFRNVNENGTLADYERSRPPVTVRSRNFRFELAAAKGIVYPDAGRPIGVFLRTATRTFMYTLLLPGDVQYATVEAILQKRAGARGTLMRSTRLSVDSLCAEWPDSPLWKAPRLS